MLHLTGTTPYGVRSTSYVVHLHLLYQYYSVPVLCVVVAEVGRRFQQGGVGPSCSSQGYRAVASLPPRVQGDLEGPEFAVRLGTRGGKSCAVAETASRVFATANLWLKVSRRAGQTPESLSPRQASHLGFYICFFWFFHQHPLHLRAHPPSCPGPLALGPRICSSRCYLVLVPEQTTWPNHDFKIAPPS